MVTVAACCALQRLKSVLHVILKTIQYIICQILLAVPVSKSSTTIFFDYDS